MHRWNALSEISPDFGPSVVTLGNFDGVHLGHQAVLSRLVRRAAELGVPSAAVTFEPHPLAVLFPDRAPPRISSDRQRMRLLEESGLDAILVMEFTRELASWTPEHFVREVFMKRLGARCVVVGEDTRFGTRNSGDVTTLRELGSRLGVEVVVLSDLGGPVRWSSSLIRERLAVGDVAGAAGVLGRAHRVAGTVVHGDHRGRSLGYPTANLGPDSAGLIPADGVYSGWLVRLDLPVGAPERELPAAVSVGTNPTFDGTTRRVEAYVLDRTDLELYGERVAIDFTDYLRPTLRFGSVDDLLTQMKTDVDRCRSQLAPRS
ncbi:MAG TPA: bifunctional riboflavin kinase/FAD synthetase [Dermatophilaceae bacterium]|nr:bifunctional riboflavin kinase/FAD synthetase [Dermatophilaceae bacterium]